MGRAKALIAGTVTSLLFLVGMIVWPSAALAAECTRVWTGTVNTEWQVAENWSPEEVPTSSDVACVPKEKTANVVSGTHSVEVLQGEGQLDVSAGSLAVVGAESSNIGTLHLPGGAIRGSAQLFVTDSLVASGGSMEAAGETVIGVEALGRVEPSGEPEGPGLRLTEKRVLTVKGELVVAGAGGKLNLLEGASVSVAGGGSLTVGGPEGRITAKEASSLTNSGTMTINGSAGQANLLEKADLLNAGSLALKAPEGGLVALDDASVENTGSLRMEGSAGEIRLEEMTLENKSALRIEAPEGRLRGSKEARVENSGTLAINGEGGGNGLVAGTGAIPRLINDGTVRKDEGTEMAFVEFKIANEDLVKTESGSLTFTAGGNSGLEHKDKWVVDKEGTEIGFIGGTFTLGELAEMRGAMVLWSSSTVKGHKINGDEAEVFVAESDLGITGSGEKSTFASLSMSSGEISVIKNGLLDAEAVFLEGGLLNLAAGTDANIDNLFQADGKTDLGNGGTLTAEGVFLEGGRLALDTNTTFQLADYFQEGEAEASIEPGGSMSSNDAFLAGGSLELRANTEGDIGQVFLDEGSFNVRKESELVSDEAFLDEGSFSLGTSSTYSVGEFFLGGAISTIGTSAGLVAEDSFLEGGVLTGEGVFTTGNLGWENAAMSGDGLTVVSEAGLVAGESSASLDERRLVTNGFFSLGESTLTMADGARLTNNAEFDASSEASGSGPQIRVSGTSSSSPRIVNRNEFNKESGGGATEVNVPFENNGAINEFSGTLRILNRLGVPTSEKFGYRCHCGDPIEIASGDLTESQIDVAVGGRGIGLVLARTYSAQSAASAASPGAFGYGWFNSFSDRLDIEEEGAQITVVRADGSTVPFTDAGEGGFDPPAWSQDTLIGSPEAGYAYKGADQIEYGFAPSGALQSVVDRNGNETTLAYTEAGRLKTITDPAERQITLSYNGEGLVESAEDPIGHIIQYGYEGEELASVTLPGEEEPRWQFEYDGSHRMTKMIDGHGGETVNEYDGASRVLSQTDPAGRTLSFEYDGFHTRFENEGTEAVSDLWFNSNNQPTSITRGYGTEDATTETFVYDEAGHQLSKTDGNGHTTSYTYNPAGDRTSMTDAAENETKWEYNGTHDVVSETTPNGLTTTIARDAAGNPEAISRPAPGEAVQTTSFEYDAFGQLESRTDPLERTWRYEYNGQGDRKAETNPEGETHTWAYDENSQLISSVSPRGNAEGAEPSEFMTTIERDPQGRPEEAIDPLGHETKYAYDANGNLEGETDAKGHTTKFVYNPVDELIETKKPNGAVLKTEYDDAGEVIAQIDGNENETTYVRNVLEQPIEIIDPLERKTTQEFDAAGNLENVVDAAERVTTFSYDPADRLEEVAYSDEMTPDASFEYDPDGNLVHMVDGSGESTYDYDPLGRLEETTNGHGDTVAYEYTLADEQERIVYPNGKGVDQAFDEAGRLESITDWLGKTTTFAYDADSNLEAIEFPKATGNVDEFSYDQLGRMTSVTMKKGTESLASIAYERDKLGQVEAMESEGLPGAEEETYEYDENNRLIKAGSESFEYDPADNPVKTPGSNNAFDKANQLETGTGVAYEYNAMGERIKSTPSAGPATTYTYDQAGNLTSVKRAKEAEVPGVDEAFSYDAKGLMVFQALGESTSFFAWDMSSPLSLLLDDGQNSYIYGPIGLPIAQISGEETPTYLHHDQLGSIRGLTNGGGEVSAAFTYGAYGGLKESTGSAATPMGFAGQYTGPQSDLQYLRARFYDSLTAQFMSPDPIQDLTLSPYGYVYGDPLNGTDPSGLFGLSDVGDFALDVADSLNPIKYYEEEIECLEEGCSYWEAVSHGAQGALVLACDVTGVAAVGRGILGRGGASLAGVGATGEGSSVVFGHGARHLAGSGLSQARVEAALAEHVVQAAPKAGFFSGRISVSGRVIEYRAFRLSDGSIKVGTYYPK